MDSANSLIRLAVTNGIAEITLDRPKALNAVNVDMARQLNSVLTEISQDASIRVILLVGAGRAFMAGGDLAYFREAEDRELAANTLIGPIHSAVEKMAEAPQPVIACVQGAVAGAGMSLAMNADFVVAEQGTIFNMAYIRVANSPDCSGTWNLPRIVGMRRAMEIIMFADDIEAEQAVSLGLINRIANAGEHLNQARELARRLSEMSGEAVMNTKRLVRRSFDNDLKKQLEEEAKAFSIAAKGKAFGLALETFFSQR